MQREQIVYIVDDDEGIREGLSLLLETVGLPAQLFSSAQEFLDAYDEKQGGCLVLDIRMPRISGLDLQKILKERGFALPIIFITGHGDIPMAVEAMRHGAMDFIRKPFREQDLLDTINQALQVDAGQSKHQQERNAILNKLASLSEREREIFERVANGDMNKVIAYDLGISERTVEVHRSHVMKKLDAKTLPALVRCKLVEEMSGSV
ncbi:response regulator transcription factor [Glaciecola sp. XM2]|jgi:FixJ family two-component response regulator|uniref:response regulator transcription factor n=1 Tax=Glaciecola sp. XM2 TaxID=1914931 RepID=UPI001BDE04AA|nr:response regulator transcription factor [Glaciecola sp. XM2]MBT1450045.1 response regulator transcription factor [Glaciecola sp. XM2]